MRVVLRPMCIYFCALLFDIFGCPATSSVLYLRTQTHVSLCSISRDMIIYIVVTTIVAGWVFYTTAMIALYKKTVPWNVKESIIPGVHNLKIVDTLYMIINAVLPIHFSRQQAKTTYPLEVIVKQRVAYYDPKADENSETASSSRS